MKRLHTQIKMYDYTSKEEYEAHILEMREKGFRLLDKYDFGGRFRHGFMIGEKWKYTACYMKVK